MRSNIPLFFGCSIIAMSINAAVGIAEQQPSRQMTLPGEKAPIVPPLIIEAGDWDVPQANQAVPMKSLFGTPEPNSERKAPQPEASNGVGHDEKEISKADSRKPNSSATSEKAAADASQKPEQGSNKKKVATPLSARADVQKRPPADPEAVAVSPERRDATDSKVETAIDASGAKAADKNPPPREKSGPKLASLDPATVSSLPGEISVPLARLAVTYTVADGIVPLAAMKLTEMPLKLIAPRFSEQEGKAKLPQLASLDAKDVKPGDILQLKRQFQDWRLSCDLNIEKNERVCSVQQSLVSGAGHALEWSIATRLDGKPVILFDFDAGVDPVAGLSISIAGFERSIPATAWSCIDARCKAVMEISGPVAGWFSNEPDVKFSFKANGSAVVIAASMAGFEKAMIASQNPLGIRNQPAEAEKKETKSEKTAQLK